MFTSNYQHTYCLIKTSLGCSLLVTSTYAKRLYNVSKRLCLNKPSHDQTQTLWNVSCYLGSQCMEQWQVTLWIFNWTDIFLWTLNRDWHNILFSNTNFVIGCDNCMAYTSQNLYNICRVSIWLCFTYGWHFKNCIEGLNFIQLITIIIRWLKLYCTLNCRFSVQFIARLYTVVCYCTVQVYSMSTEECCECTVQSVATISSN